MDIMTGIIIWIILIAAAIGLLLAIIYRKTPRGGSFAATSVFSDMQNEDKRNAMETIIEEKAGNIKHEDDNGEAK